MVVFIAVVSYILARNRTPTKVEESSLIPDIWLNLVVVQDIPKCSIMMENEWQTEILYCLTLKDWFSLAVKHFVFIHCIWCHELLGIFIKLSKTECLTHLHRHTHTHRLSNGIAAVFIKNIPTHNSCLFPLKQITLG